MKFSFKTILGFLGLVAVIIYCVHGVNFKDIGNILKGMDQLQTLFVLLLTTLNLVMRAMVFKLIIHPIKTIPAKQAISSYVVGVFSNLFLPFKLGDVAQGYFLGRKQAISKISAVSAVYVQRVFEVASLLLFMVIIALIFSFPLLLQRRTIILGLGIIIGIVLLFIAFNKRDVIGLFAQRIISRYSSNLANTIRHYIDLFIQGTSALHNFSGVIKITSLSMISWIIQIIMVKYTANALNISIDFVASSIVLFIVNLGLIVPIAPGNIGTFQFFGILALSLFSVSKSQALIFSIIFQVIQGVPVILGGSIILVNELLTRKIKTQKTQITN